MGVSYIYTARKKIYGSSPIRLLTRFNAFGYNQDSEESRSGLRRSGCSSRQSLRHLVREASESPVFLNVSGVSW